MDACKFELASRVDRSATLGLLPLAQPPFESTAANRQSLFSSLPPPAATLDLSVEAAAVHVDVPDLPQVRRMAQRTWIGRMVNEHASARVFDALAAQFVAAQTDATHAQKCREFAAEERRHGVLCAAVARALGADLCVPARLEGDLPEHADAATPLEALLRNVLSIACLSETIAVAIISAEREQMPEGDVKKILSRILADEVGHARFGWGFLAEVAPRLDDACRARLSRYLEVAFAHVEAHELAHLPDTGAPPEGAEALGVCSGRDARELFYATIEDAVIPRLEQHGIAATQAWRRRRGARGTEALEGAA